MEHPPFRHPAGTCVCVCVCVCKRDVKDVSPAVWSFPLLISCECVWTNEQVGASGQAAAAAAGPTPTSVAAAAPTWGARGAWGATATPEEAAAAAVTVPTGKKGKKGKQLLFTTSQRGRS